MRTSEEFLFQKAVPLETQIFSNNIGNALNFWNPNQKLTCVLLSELHVIHMPFVTGK